MRRYRRFNGHPFELQPRKSTGTRRGIHGEQTYSTLTDSAYFVKSDALKEATKRREAGHKIRIIESRNFKFFGGDIAFFIYQKCEESE
tara:strand:- start:3710 stop:3973 length:264 start_codon:yes stop_codon:yes gene_type:complete